MSQNDTATLVQQAIDAAKHAYAPYSNYPVGAALRTPDGDVFTGCNVENAAYPAGICAERTALVKAVSEGKREFSTIAVVTRNGGAPCGVCRQMLYEFAPDLKVIIADMDGKVHEELLLSDLLPHGFSPNKLHEGDSNERPV
jgi:cytidine deaminase